MTAIPRWEAFKARARKLGSFIAGKSKLVWAKIKPSYAVIWTCVWVPGALVTMYLAMKVLGKPIGAGVGSYQDLIDYLMEMGSRSFPLLIAIAITYLVAGRLGWNLDNAERANYQRLLVAGNRNAYGAFLVLAGEMVSILVLLWIFLRALLVWQG